MFLNWCWNRIRPHTIQPHGRGGAPRGPTRNLDRLRQRPQVEELETRTLLAQGGTWTPLLNAIPDPTGAQDMVLLSDGTIMVRGGADRPSNAMYRLTPDATGSYINGTWSTLAPLNIGRLFYPSSVLPDGRVLVVGGEFSTAAPETNTGEIYNPLTNTWTLIANFPLSTFGDSPTEVLPDGRVLAGPNSSAQTFIYDPATDTWSFAATKLRGDTSAEETWVKLPDNSILTYDLTDLPSGVGQQTAQRYVPSLNEWVDAGTVPVALGSNGGNPGIVPELGPAFLLPDGRVFYIGASGNTALYTPPTTLTGTGSWVAGPVIPGGLGAFDVPGAMMPNGDVLFAVGPINGLPTAPSMAAIMEYDPVTNTITPVATPPALTAALSHTSQEFTRMIVLPSGQVLFDDAQPGGPLSETLQLWVFTPNGGPQDAWRPRIAGVTNNGNGTFTLTGTQLTGISEGSTYGDDSENATNYPIVRITDSTGRVFYARTFNWSSTGVAQGGTPQSVLFTLPAGLAPGALSLVVIANGIPSLPFVIPAPVSVKVLYPFRYKFNSRTGQFFGNLTLDNLTSQVLRGQFTIVLLGLPPGVTLVNAAGTTSGGAPFLLFNGTLSPNKPLRLLLRFRNPKHRPLSTFYLGFPVEAILNPFVLVDPPAAGGTGATDPLAADLLAEAGLLPPPSKRHPLMYLPLAR